MKPMMKSKMTKKISSNQANLLAQHLKKAPMTKKTQFTAPKSVAPGFSAVKKG